MSAFVLVHGAFCGGQVWNDVATALRADGHRVEALDLPSSGTDAAQLGDLHADVAVVRAALDSLGADVVLVGHSGGGMVLTELADHPAVRRTVYVAALWPQQGQSVVDLLDGQMPDWIVARDDTRVQVSDDPELARKALCADLQAERFAAEVHPRYLLTSLASLSTPSTAPSWAHPTTYVICEQDLAVPLQAQEAMSAAANHVERLSSSHSPMLTMPKKLADTLERVASM